MAAILYTSHQGYAVAMAATYTSHQGYAVAMAATPRKRPVWKPVMKRPTYWTSIVMRPNMRPAARDTPALASTGSRASVRHTRYTTTDPKINPVRNITALKQR